MDILKSGVYRPLEAIGPRDYIGHIYGPGAPPPPAGSGAICSDSCSWGQTNYRPICLRKMCHFIVYYGSNTPNALQPLGAPIALILIA